MTKPAVDHVRLLDAALEGRPGRPSTLGIIPESMTPRAIRVRGKPAAVEVRHTRLS